MLNILIVARYGSVAHRIARQLENLLPKDFAKFRDCQFGDTSQVVGRRYHQVWVYNFDEVPGTERARWLVEVIRPRGEDPGGPRVVYLDNRLVGT